jgi:hypothetical protein
MAGFLSQLAGRDPSLHIPKVYHSRMLLSEIQPFDRLGKSAQLCQELDNFSTYNFFRRILTTIKDLDLFRLIEEKDTTFAPPILKRATEEVDHERS